MIIIITMAGKGSRFRDAGFNIPKHMIRVKDRSIFEWSISSLKNFFSEKFIFVAQQRDNASAFIKEKCAVLGINDFCIKEIERYTKGQAQTVIEAEEYISDTNEEVVIYNIDTFVEPDQLRPSLIKGDGWVPVFKAAGNRWSFVRFDNTLLVTEITEKKRISEFATIGLYYFRSFNLFKKCYTSSKFKDYKEEFVAPLYNMMVKNSSLDLYAYEIEAGSVNVLGTPGDILKFDPGFGKTLERYARC